MSPVKACSNTLHSRKEFVDGLTGTLAVIHFGEINSILIRVAKATAIEVVFQVSLDRKNHCVFLSS